MPRSALVVDDSMLIRHTVCRFLEERGFEVESATNGQDALRILNESGFRPDIIVTDMQMPKMTGSELITALKENPTYAEIPIVILSAKQTAPDIQERRANYAIFKDIDIEQQLQTALTAALGESAMTP